MKKIIYILIGMLIMSAFVYASEVLMSADNIGYTDDKTVSDALNDLLSKADATAEEILTGKKAYVNGEVITGSLPDNGAWVGSTVKDGKIYIPAGYHNGKGYINTEDFRKPMQWSPVNISFSNMSAQSGSKTEYSDLMDFSKIAFIKANMYIGTTADCSGIYSQMTIQVTDQNKNILFGDSKKVGTNAQKYNGDLYINVIDQNITGKGYIKVTGSVYGCTSANGTFNSFAQLKSLSVLDF